MAANSLSVLVPVLISTIQETARNTGFIIGSVARDQRLEAAALGQTVTYPSLPDISAQDVVAGPTVPEASATTAAAQTLALTNHKRAAFKLSDEDERGLAALGVNYRTEQMNLAVAAIVDAIAGDISGLYDLGAGLAFGTPGTDPFATNPNILIDGFQSLFDDKAPTVGRQGVLSSLDYASAAKLLQFQKTNEAPAGTNFGAGQLGSMAGFALGADQLVGQLHTTTAAGGYLVNNGAGYPAGTAVIVVDTGTGGFAAGDVVTIAGNVIPGTATLSQLVVKSFNAGTGALTFNRGLLSAVVDNASVVRVASHRSSFLVHPSATYYSVRPSAELANGDAATIRQIVTDPVTGISVRLAYYPGYHQGQWEISAVFGGIVRRPA